MNGTRVRPIVVGMVAAAGLAAMGCKHHPPHKFGVWPYGGDIQFSHAKPPEGGYYKNWDPYAITLEVTPVEDVNPVRTQHVLIATVKDKNGKPLNNRRVEWIISEGSVGDIVEVDESGWRASRGYKVDNHYAVTHTNNYDHVLDRGNDDPSDDIHIDDGQTWCVITSPIEGDTYITVYAPGIYDWSKHKVFVVKHWYDLKWEFPPPATNPIGTSHNFSTLVAKYSDGSPLSGYIVTYKILDGPPATLEPGGQSEVTVQTDASGMANVTLRQTQPMEGTNNLQIDIWRPENVQCCKPGAHIATGYTSKTWIGPKIAIDKSCTPSALVGDTVTYTINVTNPSQVDATNVVVSDAIPDGIHYVSSTPAGQASGQNVTWSLGTVPASGSASITVQAKATRVGRFENCADVRADHNLSGRDCCDTVVTSPKLAIEKRCPTEVTTCDNIEYVIVVRNTGDGPATNVQVTDTLPAGLTSSSGLTTNVGTLGPGESREIRITAKAASPGKYDNRVVATGAGGLTAEATCSTTVRQPVLTVTKTGPAKRYINRPASYEITVSNTGDFAAQDTVLTDPVPAGNTFVSASDGGTHSGGTVTWRLGTIEPGGSKRVSLTLTPTVLGTVTNTARAVAICAEAQASTQLAVEGIAAILLEVIDVADPIEVGANETYEITVTNQGSAVDTNIVIECTLPPEQDYVSGSGPTNPTAAGKVVRFAPLASLPPKAKATWKVVVKGTAVGDVRFGVKMTSDVITSPVEETESTHIYE